MSVPSRYMSLLEAMTVLAKKHENEEGFDPSQSLLALLYDDVIRADGERAVSPRTGHPYWERVALDSTWWHYPFDWKRDLALKTSSVVTDSMVYNECPGSIDQALFARHVRLVREDVERVAGLEGVRTLPGTGAPGRPSSKHVVLDEFERRAEAGDTLPQLKDEANALWVWFSDHRRGTSLPELGLRTIENQIRDRHRELVRILRGSR